MMKNKNLKRYFSFLSVGLFLIISCSDGNFNEKKFHLASVSEEQAPVSNVQTSNNSKEEISLFSSIKDYLSNDILNIVYSNTSTFAALKSDGTVITSGYNLSGGDPNYEDLGTSKAREKLVNVKKIVATQGAFAALTNDGKVITWGSNQYGGSSELVKDELKNVKDIASTYSAFAAVRNDGSVVTWGYPDAGGNSSDVASLLKSKVVSIFSAKKGAFAAVKEDGSLITWGYAVYGGDPSFSSETVQAVTNANINMVKIKNIFSTNDAFIALTYDGRLLGWGQKSSLIGMPFVAAGITKIVSTERAFAALMSDRTVMTWGDKSCGGDPNFNDENSVGVKEELTGIVDILSTDKSFIAVSVSTETDTQGYKKLVSWGDKNYCLNVSSSQNVNNTNVAVKNIFSNRLGFVVEQYDSKVNDNISKIYGTDGFKDFIEKNFNEQGNN